LANDSVTQLKAYSLFTFQLNHRIQKPKGNLFLSVFNVFDTAYVIIPEYATRGRNVLMGISIQID
jgi:outer membrane cobalamin receptor